MGPFELREAKYFIVGIDNFVDNLFDKEKNQININLEDEIISKTLMK